MEPYEDTMGMDADELLLMDIRAVVTGPPSPAVPVPAAADPGSVEQHTVKASGS